MNSQRKVNTTWSRKVEIYRVAFGAPTSKIYTGVGILCAPPSACDSRLGIEVLAGGKLSRHCWLRDRLWASSGVARNGLRAGVSAFGTGRATLRCPDDSQAFLRAREMAHAQFRQYPCSLARRTFFQCASLPMTTLSGVGIAMISSTEKISDAPGRAPHQTPGYASPAAV